MPKYQANEYLAHEGKVIQTGEYLDLTDEQAERLGHKVTKVESSKRKKEENLS